ncbi:MAG: VOC family protein [Bacteroidota bacterium]
MEIDHIFIFSKNKGEEADELVEKGFTEGSSRIHPGQGTRNRKFYFENFFLEILWVVNKWEIQDERTRATQLWERSQFEKNGHSPIGVCLLNTPESDAIFSLAQNYQPIYFPGGMPIEFLPHPGQEFLPWTFRLPFKGKLKKADKPRIHPQGTEMLTEARFGIPDQGMDSSFVSAFQYEEQISFYSSDRIHLSLIFDQHRQKESITFESLPLEIHF